MPTPLISPIRFPSGLIMERKPETDFELWVVTQTLLGLKVPRTKVCKHHTAPFQVFANNFFGRVGVQIIKGSRGLSGKSYMSAGLGQATAILHGCKVNVLGGSAAQSLNVHEHMQTFWEWPNAPKYMLADDPTKYETKLRNGGKIRALMASSRSVRGPHPARLFLDEIDEMELDILDSAMGMPMDQKIVATGEVIPAATLMVSTLQYAGGTMSKIIERAKEKVGWEVHEVCFREAANPIDGWLDLSLVRSKRRDVSRQMWDVEYELGEPSIEGRAITSEFVKLMFDRNRTTRSGVLLGMYEGKVGQEYVFEEPQRGVRYATGVDWARTKDYTVITTYRMDTWEMVAFQRTNKEPWPVMIGKAIARYKRFPGLFAHDATGLGDVISDVFPSSLREDDAIHDVKMMGSTRANLFSEYVTAIEQEALLAPYIEWVHDEHLYCTHDDLYRSGNAFHPPDSVVSGALCWYLRQFQPSTAAPVVDNTVPTGEGWYDGLGDPRPRVPHEHVVSFG